MTNILSRAAVAGLAALGIVACGSRPPESAVERLSRGRELVQQMSARLAAANVLSVTTTEVREVVRGSGRKESVSLTGVYTMRRPDRFHGRMTGGRGLEFWYNGKTLTIASHPEKVFAQAPMPDTIDRTIDAVTERFDIPMPMGDLFYSAAEKALLSETATGGYTDTEAIAGTPCVRLAFQDTGVDWELWLPAKGDPLPQRLKVVQKGRTGQPMIDITFTAWDIAPRITDATFVPKLPAEYEGIALVQRAAALKNAGK